VLKAVLDTSVFVAVFKATHTDLPSHSRVAFQAWMDNRFILVTSPPLIAELVTVLLRLNVSELVIQQVVGAINQFALAVPGIYETTRLDKVDPKDNMFLAVIYESQADYLVSLDAKHLLPIKHFHRSQIVSPELFLRFLNRYESGTLSE